MESLHLGGKKKRFYKFNKSTNTCLQREVSGVGGGGGVVLTYLFSLEEAGAEWLGGRRMCPSPPPMARVMAGTGRSQLPATRMGSVGAAALGTAAGDHSKGG